MLTVVAVVDADLGSAAGAVRLGLPAQTEFQAVQFMPAIIIPQLLLRGLLVPRDAMPPFLEAISDVLPLSYAVDAMQHLTTSTSTGQVWQDVAVVAAFAVGGPGPRGGDPAPSYRLTCGLESDGARPRS